MSSRNVGEGINAKVMSYEERQHLKFRIAQEKNRRIHNEKKAHTHPSSVEIVNWKRNWISLRCEVTRKPPGKENEMSASQFTIES